VSTVKYASQSVSTSVEHMMRLITRLYMASVNIPLHTNETTQKLLRTEMSKTNRIHAGQDCLGQYLIACLITV